MINDFEDHTHELTDYELKTLLPLITLELWGKVGFQNAITSTKILEILKNKHNGERDFIPSKEQQEALDAVLVDNGKPAKKPKK